MNLPVLARRGAFTAILLSLSAVPAAQAGTTSTTTTPTVVSCDYAYEQPFSTWGDTSLYGLTPTGSFEAGTASGWALSGGAAVRAPGNPLRPTSSLYSLSLPAGSTATSPPICIEAGTPTARLFANTPVRNSAYGAALKVEIIYTDAGTGKTVTRPVTTLAQKTGWGAAEQMALGGPLSVKPGKDGRMTVRYKFTPLYKTGWSIDDLFIDPKKHRT
jgi:hypothetical protein